jgi:protoporphyrinogen oxidase
VQFENGQIVEYDNVISTMPFSQLVLRLPNVPKEIIEQANKLRFRNTILIYFKVESPNLFPDQWLYMHSKGLETGRISNFKNWVPSINNGESATILCLEYWCNFEDKLWKTDDEQLIDFGKKELIDTGLTKGVPISDGKVYRIPRCYPIYFKGYKEVMKPIQDYVSTIKGLQPIGRYGSYKYNNQDHSIYMGLLAAENVLFNKNHNLWDINTDYESYQESSVITKTGLQKA